MPALLALSGGNGRRGPVLSLAGGAALAGSPFLPWLRLGSVSLTGIPDPAGFFVLALGLIVLAASILSAWRRRSVPFLLLCAGVAAVTTLVVVWRTGPTTVADRALAHAQAVALVDNVAVEPVPPVTVGYGMFVGIAGGLVVTLVGLSEQARRPGGSD